MEGCKNLKNEFKDWMRNLTYQKRPTICYDFDPNCKILFRDIPNIFQQSYLRETYYYQYYILFSITWRNFLALLAIICEFERHEYAWYHLIWTKGKNSSAEQFPNFHNVNCDLVGLELHGRLDTKLVLVEFMNQKLI